MNPSDVVLLLWMVNVNRCDLICNAMKSALEAARLDRRGILEDPSTIRRLSLSLLCIPSMMQDFRKTYQKQNPDVKSMRDIGKACGEKWKTMSFEEKVAYYDIATEKRAEFEKAMSEYIKRRESGEEESEQSEE
ncbi:hypothetical protein Taro_051937 [Colocasia esculenta]|uniref:HMG box domain-containing protein n=1 Tax=Colocasia esculenta TaxID=4460 RepID=A0A843XIR7_COLES|nr:hypothetical protein [Colocasia esculenta]